MDTLNEVNARGNVVHRDCDADAILGFRGGSRYAYDFRILQDGWEQYDTTQDESCFGCWVVPSRSKRYSAVRDIWR